MTTVAPVRRVYIDRDVNGFRVTIAPPPDGESFDGIFPTFKRARGWASGCRLNFGWQIVDRTCAGDAPAKQQH